VRHSRVKSFKRVFEYIWPQWPRIIVVVISAMLVSALLSISIMTAIPMLKVMTGEEGLRGWLDRKVCQLRYGMTFFVPQSIDFTHNPTSNLLNSLQITSVAKDGAATSAGLKPQDKIIAIGSTEPTQSSLINLIDSLANAAGPTTTITISRLDEKTGKLEQDRLTLDTTWKNDAHGRLTQLALKAAHIVPIEQTANDKTKAIVFIIIAIGIVTIIS
jgi:membrane-associated protease RseP (regulator of RpoE activity)